MTVALSTQSRDRGSKKKRTNDEKYTVKHLQSRTNNLVLSEEALSNYLLLRSNLFSLIPVEENTCKCTNINGDMEKKNDNRLNFNKLDKIHRRLYLHCSNTCGSTMVQLLESKYIKPTIEQTRKFVLQMFSLHEHNTVSRDQIVEVFHCAVLDVANAACALVFPIEESDNKSFLKHALMAIFTVVRGIVTDLSKQTMKQSNKKDYRIKALFLAPTLHYLVPKLTKFSQHAENTKLSLGSSADAFKRCLEYFEINYQRFGLSKDLVHAWMRQLSEQEQFDRPNIRYTMKPTPSPHSGCLVNFSDISNFKEHSKASQTVTCQLHISGWPNCTECECESCVRVNNTYQNPYDKKRQKTKHENQDKMVELKKIYSLSLLDKTTINLLRYKGCVLMEKVLCLLCPKHLQHDSIGNNQTDSHRIISFRLTSFYLFHFLLQDGRLRSKDMHAVILACISLAGKNEDHMISISRLLQKSQGLLHDSDQLLPSLVKAYEFQLVSLCGFFLDTNNVHPLSFIHDFKCKLKLSDEVGGILEDLVTCVGYTHSALCLLKRPREVLAAIYFKFGKKEKNFKWISRLQDILGFDEMTGFVMKQISRHMEDVESYVASLQTNHSHPKLNPPDIKALIKSAREITHINSSTKHSFNEQVVKDEKQITTENSPKLSPQDSPFTRCSLAIELPFQSPLIKFEDYMEEDIGLSFSQCSNNTNLSYTVSPSTIKLQQSLSRSKEASLSPQSNSDKFSTNIRATHEFLTNTDDICQRHGIKALTMKSKQAIEYNIDTKCSHDCSKLCHSSNLIKVSNLPCTVTDCDTMQFTLRTFKCDSEIFFFSKTEKNSAIIWFTTDLSAETARACLKGKRFMGRRVETSNVGPSLLLLNYCPKICSELKCNTYIIHQSVGGVLLEFNCEKCREEVSCKLKNANVNLSNKVNASITSSSKLFESDLLLFESESKHPKQRKHSFAKNETCQGFAKHNTPLLKSANQGPAVETSTSEVKSKTKSL